jgi:hypothetical protein
MNTISVGQPRIKKRHRIVQTRNLTYCPTVTFVTALRRYRCDLARRWEAPDTLATGGGLTIGIDWKCHASRPGRPALRVFFFTRREQANTASKQTPCTSCGTSTSRSAPGKARPTVRPAAANTYAHRLGPSAARLGSNVTPNPLTSKIHQLDAQCRSH